MALFSVAYSTDPTVFNVHAVEADNAEKMQLLVNSAFAAAVGAGEIGFVDINLSGTGAGPNWQCWFTTTSHPGDHTVGFELAGSAVVVDAAASTDVAGGTVPAWAAPCPAASAATDRTAVEASSLLRSSNIGSLQIGHVVVPAQLVDRHP